MKPPRIGRENPWHQDCAYFNLPLDATVVGVWNVEGDRATLETPGGRTDVELAVFSSLQHGTVDWKMSFPNDGVSWARSRIVPLGSDRCVYIFVLPMPPAELEKLEGTLEKQGRLLRHELQKLKRRLNGNEPEDA